MKRCFLLLLASCSLSLRAQTCDSARPVEPSNLVGKWQVWLAVPGQANGQQGELVLGPHPDYRDTLRGTLQWASSRVAVVADLDEDAFTMEESADGQRISATWVGDLVKGSCGRRIEGQRLGRGGSDSTGPAFRLQRP